jgi:hypothetical protein
MAEVEQLPVSCDTRAETPTHLRDCVVRNLGDKFTNMPPSSIPMNWMVADPVG